LPFGRGINATLRRFNGVGRHSRGGGIGSAARRAARGKGVRRASCVMMGAEHSVGLRFESFSACVGASVTTSGKVAVFCAETAGKGRKPLASKRATSASHNLALQSRFPADRSEREKAEIFHMPLGKKGQHLAFGFVNLPHPSPLPLWGGGKGLPVGRSRVDRAPLIFGLPTRPSLHEVFGPLFPRIPVNDLCAMLAPNRKDTCPILRSRLYRLPAGGAGVPCGDGSAFLILVVRSCVDVAGTVALATLNGPIAAFHVCLGIGTTERAQIGRAHV